MNKCELILRCARFLIDGQTRMGGWGNEPGPNKEANPLNTGEVLLGLITASDHMVNLSVFMSLRSSIEAGIRYLISTQLSSGGWSTGSAYLEKPITAQGNIVSTSISVWAVVEYMKRHDNNDELKDLINRSYNFICNCIKNNSCRYSPNLDSDSVVASAYCLLSLCILHEASLVDDPNLPSKITRIINLIACDLDDCECKEIVLLLSFIAIKFLMRREQLEDKLIINFYNRLRTIILNLDEEKIKNSITEKQVVREVGKPKRDYIHYMPFWYSIAVLFYPDIIKTKQLANAFYVLSKNIDMDDDCGVMLGGKALTWATGQTLMAYCFYFDTIDVDDILKLEGFSMADRKKVFIVHGRNNAFKSKICEYLRLIGLTPLEWEMLITDTTPFTFNVVEHGFKEAQAVLILLTGDDEAKCIEEYLQNDDEDYEKKLTPQPRLNVIFEAGMALALYKERTIIVRFGRQRKFTDIEGMNFINLSDISAANATSTFKTSLNKRLANCGCDIDTKTNNEWIDFKFQD